MPSPWCFASFSFKWFAEHRYLHSFPTRRSSDLLNDCVHLRAGCKERGVSKNRNAGPASATLCSLALIPPRAVRSEEHTSELQSQSNLVCRLLLEKKKILKNLGRCSRLSSLQSVN